MKCFFLAGTCTDVPTGRLEEVISDEDVATIARKQLTDWESLRPYLGLDRQQQVVIRNSYPGDYGQQKRECLEVWKEIKGNGATYGALITAAENANNQLFADRVKGMLATKPPSSKRYESVMYMYMACSMVVSVEGA